MRHYGVKLVDDEARNVIKSVEHRCISELRWLPRRLLFMRKDFSWHAVGNQLSISLPRLVSMAILYSYLSSTQDIRN